MDGTRPRQPLSDSQLDRELERALGVDPSPEFLACVRTRIAAAPEQSVSSVVSAFRRTLVVSGFSRTFFRRAVEPLAAVAIVGIVLTVVAAQWMRDEREQPRTVTVSVADTANAAGSGLQVGPVPPLKRTNPIRRPLPQMPADSVHTVPLQLSPVLFAEDDERAFALFVTAVSEGRVAEEAVQVMGEEDMAPLVIAPLMIAPLPTLARVEKQGEDQW